ncbi:MAG: PQQ-like beta-propeller repeat protein, partial [Phycisphaerales bacterium]|nr:PQQ-like beta-propeller repeat protein [Phycisphaerales bacterium]
DGLTATLQLARVDLSAGRFGTCRRRIASVERHPDLVGPARQDAAAIVQELARFHPPARSLAERLGAQSVTTGPGAAEAAGTATTTPSTPPPDAPMDFGALVARPLWQQEIGPEDLSTPASPRWLSGTSRMLATLPTNARELRVLPLSGDDRVVVQRDHAIMALDASTLRPLWSFDTMPAGIDPSDARSGIEPEELSTPAFAGGLVLSTLIRENDRTGAEQELVALDARTGRVRWAVNASEIDPSIGQSGLLRGAILADADTAVIGIRKRMPERRLAALYLAGIDISSGRTRWSTLIGASGVLPFAAGSPIVDSGIIDDGIVYRSDRLGVVCAVEAASGRLLWVRRLPVELAPMRSGLRSATWQQNAPVLIGESVFVITPDRSEILRLSATTGRVEARSATDVFFTPSYLLKDGGTLLAVSDSRVASVSAASFGDASKIRATSTIETPGIWGRVSIDRGRVLVPLVSGLAVFDPSELGAPKSVVRLDRPGNPMIVGEQLVVTDDSRVLVYSDWERAERVLSRSIQERPADPAPAIALLELAARTGRLARAVQAIDAAKTALDAARPGGDRNAEAQRLWDVSVALVDSQLARSQRQGAGGPLDASIIEVIDRLAILATTPNQRVTQMLLSAQSMVVQNRLGDAIKLCQRVLADEALRAAQFITPRSTARADQESTRRLEQCIRAGGRPDYAEFEALASGELQALIARTTPNPPNPVAPASTPAAAPPVPTPVANVTPPTPDEFEEIARRYPVALASLRAWSLASAAHDRAGQARGAARAAESGLLACDRIGDAP